MGFIQFINRVVLKGIKVDQRTILYHKAVFQVVFFVSFFKQFQCYCLPIGEKYPVLQFCHFARCNPQIQTYIYLACPLFYELCYMVARNNKIPTYCHNGYASFSFIIVILNASTNIAMERIPTASESNCYGTFKWRTAFPSEGAVLFV